MKILSLAVSSRVSEVSAISGRISDGYHKDLEGDVVLDPIFNEIDPVNQSTIAAIKRIKAESKLQQLDELRDTAHHALFHFVLGLSLCDMETIRNAASLLMTILHKYGLSVTRENYDEKSSDLDSMLLELKKPNILAAIALIDNCALLIASLQSKQDTFKAERLAFQHERANESQQMNATSLKSTLLKLINKKLIPVLNGLQVSNAAKYGDFAATVAKIISTNNETVKQRRTQLAEPEDKE